MARQKITMEKQIRNTQIYRDILRSIGGKCDDTVSVYVNGKFFARYSRAVGMEVFDDIKVKSVDVVDDSTGEILRYKREEEI